MTPNQSAMLILKDFKRRDLSTIISWDDFTEAELRVATEELIWLFRSNPETPPLPLLYDYQERMTELLRKKPRNKSFFDALAFVTGLVIEKLVNSV